MLWAELVVLTQNLELNRNRLIRLIKLVLSRTIQDQQETGPVKRFWDRFSSK